MQVFDINRDISAGFSEICAENGQAFVKNDVYFARNAWNDGNWQSFSTLKFYIGRQFL